MAYSQDIAIIATSAFFQIKFGADKNLKQGQLGARGGK
jgi:hypothetical protein